MSKNKQSGVEQLASLFPKAPLPQAIKNEVAARNARIRGETTRPNAYIGKIEAHYLDVALAKAMEPLHPNFVRAASASTLAVYRRIQNEIKLADAKKLASSKQVAVAVGRAVRDDARTYVTFWTTLMSNVAFAGHMDMLTNARALDPSAVESSLDAMGEDHRFEAGDEPAFDRSAKEHQSLDASDEMEHPFAHPDVPSDEEIYEAMNSIQSWIAIAFRDFSAQQVEYWQLYDVPFCKRGADDDYAPITDFDEYRAFQTEQWRRKQRTVKADDALADMEEAAA